MDGRRGCEPMEDRGPHGETIYCHHQGMRPCGPGRGPHSGFMRERLLDLIAGHDEGVHQKELVEELKINPSSVSELISKLQSDGYIVRTVDPNDKRATLIRLTELGEARAAEIADERQAHFSKAFACLSAEEKEQLVSLLEKLTPTVTETE